MKRVLPFAAILMPLSACDPAPDPRSEVTEWELVEDLRLGTPDVDGPELFGFVADVSVDPLGRIWVADGPSHTLRVFDADGRFVRSVGREGAGPGEIGTVVGLEWGPDRHVWVADGQNGRWTVFDTAGVWVESHSYAPGMYRFGDRWGPDGLLYTHVFTEGDGGARESALVARRPGPDGLLPVDTFPVPAAESGETVQVSFVRDGRRMTLFVPIPFHAVRERLLLAGEGWWLSHPGPEYRLAKTNRGGDTLRTVDLDYERVPVTDEDIDRTTLGRMDNAEFDRTRVPEYHPPVAGLAVLPDEHLLVRRRVGASEVFDVIAPRGGRVATMPIPGPGSFTLHTATDDALYGVVEGSLGEPYVVRWLLRRR